MKHLLDRHNLEILACLLRPCSVAFSCCSVIVRKGSGGLPLERGKVADQ